MQYIQSLSTDSCNLAPSFKMSLSEKFYVRLDKYNQGSTMRTTQWHSINRIEPSNKSY